MLERLKDPANRARIGEEMQFAFDDWENMYLSQNRAEKILLAGFQHRCPQAADRQDAGGGRGDARHIARRYRSWTC